MVWLDKCLKSCGNYSVIVVDNASTDGTVSFIERNYPNIEIFIQDTNLGFGRANNIGISFALEQGAEHVFLLNQDAYLVDDILDNMVNFQIKNPQYGILSPIHITGNRKRLDKNFFNFMLKEKTGQFYSDFVLGNNIAKVYEVPFVNAAAWLISRKCLEEVGGFDPIFFHYGEDDNYCQRVIYHGFRIGVLPKIYIIHDREYREHPKHIIFSDAYYKEKEKIYKLKFTNILSENLIEQQFKQLRNKIRKSILKLDFHRALKLKKELRLLKKMSISIEKSRKKTAEIGPTYLKSRLESKE